jgi:uncharacterized membrane protein YczE
MVTFGPLASAVRRSAGHLRVNRRRYSTYIGGCLLFSSGATFFIYSRLGTDPLDTFSLGLLRHVPLTIGIAQAIVAAICIAIWSTWNRRRPVISPFITFFFCGSVIDVLRAVGAAGWVPAPRFVDMLFGVVLCAYGSALIIMSGVGIRAMDLVVITMTMRWRWPFWISKTSTETVLLVTGFVMGGPVGIGTLCFLAFVDTLIQPMMWFNGRVLRMHNLGLPTANVPQLAPVGA